MNNLTQIPFLILIVFLHFNVKSQTPTVISSPYAINPSPITESCIIEQDSLYINNVSWNNNTIYINGTANNYGCIDSSSAGMTFYHPQWVYLKCDQSGDLDFTISNFSGAWLSYVVYGPFNSYSSMVDAAVNHQLGSSAAPIDTCKSEINFLLDGTIYNMSQDEYYLIGICHEQLYGYPFNSMFDIVGGTATIDSTIVNNNLNQHIIKGMTYYDQNENGVFDSPDYPLSTQNIHIDPLNLNVFSDLDGEFNLTYNASGPQTYNVSASVPNYYALTTQQQYQFTLDSLNSTKDSLTFGLFIDSLFYNCGGNFNAAQINSCVIANSLSFMLTNNGTLPANCSVTLTLDNALSFLNSSPSYIGANGNDHYFEIDSIQPLSSTSAYLSYTPDPMLGVGDTVVNYIKFEYKDSLDNVFNTVYDTVISPVICSYDPNDKQVFSNNKINPEFIGPSDKLIYTIQFQNTGSAPAINIEILDTISANLDMTTFKVLGYSHNLMTSLDSNRQISFYFEEIYLPDSSFNEPESHGWVSYQIYPKPGLVPFDEIRNTAFIYFDYNAPVVTNTTINKIECFTIPPNISIVDNGYSLGLDLSGTGYNYQWYLNGNILNGENSDQLIYNKEAGTYSVLIIDQYGCEATVDYTFYANQVNTESNEVSVYPNPSSDDIIISSDNISINRLIIYDESGRTVLNERYLENKFVIKDNILSSGIYILQLLDDQNHIYTKKVVKF